MERPLETRGKIQMIVECVDGENVRICLQGSVRAEESVEAACKIWSGSTIW